MSLPQKLRFPVRAASSNGRFEARWPNGDKPSPSLGGAAVATAAAAATLTSGGGGVAAFSDGFESGGFAAAQNGISWAGSNYGPQDLVQVNNGLAETGTYSLLLRHGGGVSGEDSWAEERISIATPVSEIYIKYGFYVPPNYVHRNDSPGNNKFLAVYAAPYGTPGFQVNVSTGRIDDNNSKLDFHIYDNGAEQSPVSVPGAFISAADKGTWLGVILRVKVPTSLGSGDGVMEIWKNGSLWYSRTNLAIFGSSGRNYINEIYLLGWANSGFAVDTDFRVDNVVIAYSNIWGV